MRVVLIAIMLLFFLPLSFAQKDQECVASCESTADYWDAVAQDIYDSKGYYCGYMETNCGSREGVEGDDPCWSMCYESPFDNNGFQACCYESALINNDDSYNRCVAACPDDRSASDIQNSELPQVRDDVEQMYSDNNEIFNSDNPQEELPDDSSGSIVEDIKRLIRAKAFSAEDAAKIESVIDMYSDNPEEEKNLITVLAVVGLIPDGVDAFMTVVSPTDLMKSVAAEVLDAYAEDQVDVLATLSDQAKDQLYENLGKTLPKLLEYKHRKQQLMGEIYQQIQFNNQQFQDDDNPFPAGGN